MNPRRALPPTHRPYRARRRGLTPHIVREAGPEPDPVTDTARITIELTLPAGDAVAVLHRLRPFIDRYGSVRVGEEPPAAVADPTDGAVHLFPESRTVTHRDTEVALTRREFDLLLHLAEHPRRVFGRGQLLRSVWGGDDVGQRTVDVHVRRLRQKLGTPTPLLATVRGVGYRLHDRAELVIVR